MSIRKKVLMIALASLVCFQPQVKADDSLWFRAIVIIGAVGLVYQYQPTISKAFKNYPMSKTLGDVISRAKQFVTGIYEKVQKSAKDYLSREQELSDLHKEVAELKTALHKEVAELKTAIANQNEDDQARSNVSGSSMVIQQSPDRILLEKVKNNFNDLLKAFEAKDHAAYAHNVFKYIGNLEATMLTDSDPVVTFCKNREKTVDISDNPQDIQGLSYKFIHHNQYLEIKQKVEKMKMTHLEYEEVYKKTVDQEELKPWSFSELLTHMDQQFTDRRRNRNKKIINFCFAQIACQEDAAERVQAMTLDPAMIILKSRQVAQEQKQLTDRTGQALQLPTHQVVSIFAADR